MATTHKTSFVFLFLICALLTSSRSKVEVEEKVIIEFQDVMITDISTLKEHNSPMPESGNWWIKVNGELVKNKRKTFYLWKGEPTKRSAISGRVDAEGVWKWKQRPASQGYAPFDLEIGDKLHMICRNGEEINRCYEITRVKTDAAGVVRYFKGKKVPC